jgi:hypothetical protein
LQQNTCALGLVVRVVVLVVMVVLVALVVVLMLLLQCIAHPAPSALNHNMSSATQQPPARVSQLPTCFHTSLPALATPRLAPCTHHTCINHARTW